MARLQQGAEFLKIPLPFTPERLRDFASSLVARNRMPDSLLRLTLSRGVGVRGYSPKGAQSPVLVMSLHPAPALEAGNSLRWRLTSPLRLVSRQTNRSPDSRPATNCPAKFSPAPEADSLNADEALLLNTNGHVVEASSSNLSGSKRHNPHSALTKRHFARSNTGRGS